MSYRPKDHYKPHPLLAARPDGMIQLTSIDPNLVVHPLQLREYIQYDNDVRRRNVTTNTFVPAGYTEFAAAYNASKGDNPCEFTTWDETTSSYNIDNFSIPPSILTFPYCDPRYNDFRVFGLIKPNGDVDTTRWDMTRDALLRPHREAVRNQARADSRREEKALKKRRYEEAHPNGFSIGSSSKTESSRKTRKYKRSRGCKDSSSSPERAADDDHDEPMAEGQTAV